MGLNRRTQRRKQFPPRQAAISPIRETQHVSTPGLRPTHTPAVLITRGRINEQLGKIANLAPLDERRKVSRLLIEGLEIADARRRERYCAEGCRHWWHRLSAVNPTCPL
ncbi:DUF5958 family protein [Streptomyces sp. NPDC021356]|uniref:DUF5958 family protein n=1 Tax=Streptomyces sp. NPDC021356 TaxID=3154900 RepID=UPI0033EF6309